MSNKSDFTNLWKSLEKHFSRNLNLKISDQFKSDPNRFSKFSLDVSGVFLDYSKNRITEETIRLLCDLANASDLAKHRDDMFSGKRINNTEDRPVLHTALRNLYDKSDVSGLVKSELDRIAACVNSVKNKVWRGYSNKAITDVVNIGIGGSDLGPAMVVKALKPYAEDINVHFVSNVDATDISEVLKYLNPETTLFIIASKTFTTQETITNGNAAREWLLNKALGTNGAAKKHFIAVTANPAGALEFGIDQDNVFPFWDWVGGRFSLWSSIGISIAFSIGMDNFYKLLEGAYEMDQHFKKAPFEQNMPVILGVLGVWNVNFLGATSQAVIPYDQYLSLFPSYLQQLEMESNGKRVMGSGEEINYKTSPIVWGGVGTNTQHSFHQLLMQGTQKYFVDFIVPLKSHNKVGSHHLMLYANCLAQSQALMCGCHEDELVKDLKSQGKDNSEIERLIPHKIIPGNVSSNTIILNEVNPKSLGALIALYEHKVFVQGVIWRINSFDQWGVELGKKIAGKLIPMLQGESELLDLDGSTKGLIELKRSGEI